MPDASSTVMIDEYTAEACFSCRVKKRKCDKLLPACSRCASLNQRCLYGKGAEGLYGHIVPIPDQELVESCISDRSILPPQSLSTLRRGTCRRCKHQKKFCDQAYPCCARCQRLKIPCAYEKLERLSLFTSEHVFFSSPSIPDSLPYQPSYPIKTSPDIPVLLRGFQDRMGLLGMPVEAGSIASFLRSSWIAHAMNDPCLFHATLYIASAHVDTLRNASSEVRIPPNPATLYHHTKTIAAVNSRLAAGDIPNDATVGAVLLLLLSASIQGESHAAEVHNMGLLRMVSMRGGLESLGFGGILASMIQIHTILPAVVFGQVDAFPGQWLKSPAALDNIPALTLARLEGYRTGGSHVGSYMATIFFQVWKLLLLVDSSSGEDDIKEYPFNFDGVRVLLDQLEDISSDGFLADGSSTTERAMVRSCEISLGMLRYLLDDRLPLERETGALKKLAGELKSHLSMTDAPTWIKYAPHANLWVVMVGIAVSEDDRERLWFLMNERSVVLSVDASQPIIHENAWSCYRWLRWLIHVRSSQKTVAYRHDNER